MQVSIERQYIEGLKRGSYKDFTKLYNLYASRLYAFALSLSSSEAISKDIVQETFIKVWINRSQIDPNKSFKSYLFMIARNQLVTEFRNQLKRPSNVESLEIFEKTLVSDQENQLELELSAFSEELEEAKKKLSPRQRQFFELNKEQGLSVAEISSITSVSEQSIRNQLSQAAIRLREELKKYSKLYSILFL